MCWAVCCQYEGFELLGSFCFLLICISIDMTVITVLQAICDGLLMAYYRQMLGNLYVIHMYYLLDSTHHTHKSATEIACPVTEYAVS